VSVPHGDDRHDHRSSHNACMKTDCMKTESETKKRGPGRPQNALGPARVVTVSIPQELLERLDARACQMSRSAAVCAAVLDWLEDDGPPRPISPSGGLSVATSIRIALDSERAQSDVR